jgi:hypothetical protein
VVMVSVTPDGPPEGGVTGGQSLGKGGVTGNEAPERTVRFSQMNLTRCSESKGSGWILEVRPNPRKQGLHSSGTVIKQSLRESHRRQVIYCFS